MVAATFAAVCFSGAAAYAASIKFGNFVSTNGADKLSPLVTVDDSPVGSFLVTVTHQGTSDGHLNLIGFDLGAAAFASGDVTNVKNDGSALALANPCPGGQGPSSGQYCFGTSVPLGGNSNNLNGNLGTFNPSDLDVVLAFRNNDSIADNGSTLTFNLSDLGGTLSLADFLSVGLRYQSSNNQAGSDKLAGYPVTPPPNVVPLPAAGWMLIAGVGGLVAMKRRKKA